MEGSHTTRALIDQLIRETDAPSAEAAIKARAGELLGKYVASFGEPTPPIDVNVLASLQDIFHSDEPPLHSTDAEISPDADGRVVMRVNPDRPETRKRFSMAHEISHTFFPDYQKKPWCRTDARYRDRSDPDEYLEMLCDVGAAELLFPEPWFSRDAATVTDADGLLGLSATYHASREATLRRYVETSPDSVAAVFFTWKLKPTQKGTVGNKDQGNLFGILPEDALRDALRLRIEYAIGSDAFKAAGHFLPKDKSVQNDGSIFSAAATGRPAHDECHLDLGQASGTYRVWAIPLWTAGDQLGARGENAVAALLKPISVRKARTGSKVGAGPTLFDEPNC